MKFKHSLRDNSVFSENSAFSNPMGVATYKTTFDTPEELRWGLPDIKTYMHIKVYHSVF